MFVIYPEIPVDAEYRFERCEEEFIKQEYRVNQLALNTEMIEKYIVETLQKN